MVFSDFWFNPGGGGPVPPGPGPGPGQEIAGTLRNNRSGTANYHTASMPAFPDGFTNVSYTLSCWFKSDTSVPNGSHQCLFSCVSATRNEIWLMNNGYLRVYRDNAAVDFPAQIIGDNTGWYHLFVKADNVTPATGKIWLNGVEIPESAGTSVTLPNIVATAVDYRIGADFAATPVNYFSGGLAEFHFLAGSGSSQTTTPETFATTNAGGVWTPIEVDATLNHGTSGFHLDYDGTDVATWLDDKSTSGNNFTGFQYNTEVDPAAPNTFYLYPGIAPDTPSNVVPTFDGQLYGDNHVYYNGSYLYLDNNVSTSTTLAAFDPATAKSFYAEFMCYSMSKASYAGLCRQYQPNTRTLPANMQEKYCLTSGGGVIENDVSIGSTGVGYGTQTIVGMRFDTSTKELTFVINDTDLSPVVTLPTDGTKFTFFAAQNSNKSRSGWVMNFGMAPWRYPTMNGGFGTLDTNGGVEPVITIPSQHHQVIAAPGNGVRTWSEPDGTAINAAVDIANATSGPFTALPVSPAAQRNWIHDFGSAKASVTHTHAATQGGLTYALSEDGTTWTTVSTTYTVTADTQITSTAAENGGNNVRYVRLFHPTTAWGIGLTAVTGGTSILDVAQAAIPTGLWWIKDRSTNTTQHQLVDTVRGQVSGNWQAQTTPTINPAVIDYVPPTGEAVAWCWSAPDQFDIAAGTDGSDVASTGRRNVAAGFSIVQWSGPGGLPCHVGHGLDSAPDFVIAHAYARAGANNWNVYIRGMTVPGTLYFNSTVAAGTEGAFQDDPDEHNLDLGDVLGDTPSCIAYCWHKVPNYSDFGTLVAGGRTNNGPVYLGFKPKFVMVKAMSAASGWYVFDSSRNPHNPVNLPLYPDQNWNEGVGAGGTLWFMASGFRFKSNSGINVGGATYLWAAFAEHPFTGSGIAPPTGF